MTVIILLFVIFKNANQIIKVYVIMGVNDDGDDDDD